MTIAAAVEEAITAADFKPATKRRLSKCVPMLTEVVSEMGPVSPGPSLIIAAATRRGCIVLQSQGWPAFETLSEPAPARADVAKALPTLIESSTPQGDELIIGLTLLLGEAGIAAHDADAVRCIAGGERPLTVLLVEAHGGAVTTLVTIVGLPPVSLH